MKFKGLVCLVLLAATTVQGQDDQWSWGAEGKESPKTSSSFPAVKESTSREGHALETASSTLNIGALPLEDGTADFVHESQLFDAEGQHTIAKSLPIENEPLPLEPHGSLTYSVAGEGDVVDGLVVAQDGDREGRFLGLSEKLCSYGIGINCAKKYPDPVKSHYGLPAKVVGGYGPPLHINSYGPPKPLIPKGTYGPPHALPPPPYLPNRNYNAPPTKGSASAFDGLLSVLKPFIPNSKAQAPHKSSHGGILSPAYNAPNPNYAPLLPSYNPPVNPPYLPPTPSYTAPQPAYSPPEYIPPKPAYIAPKPSYEQKVGFANPGPAVNVHPEATIVEQHHHTHTHIYNGQPSIGGVYKNDNIDVFQKANDNINQINQHVVHRQDASEVSSHGISHDFAHLAQPTVKHVTRTQFPVKSPAVPSVIPADLVGSAHFQPGRIESGFQPSASVLEPIFRQQQPAYREDCQCVAAAFCTDQDVIARSLPEDLSNVIDARSKKTDILSNATDSAEANDEVIDVAKQGSARRGKVLALFADDNSSSTEVTENYLEEATEDEIEVATEYFTEYPEDATEVPIEEEDLEYESSRVRRDANVTAEETEDPSVLYSDRQGRQLTGFTPGSGGCGPDHVCCRRPVFRARRQQISCGKRNADGLLGRVKVTQVVEGNTDFGEYPWQAAILKRDNGDMLYVCGATLIDDRHVLTAAHCVDEMHPSQLKIRLGEWDVSGETEFYAHVELRAAGVYRHPEFYAGNLNNDIAVIRLEKNVDFSSNPHITPVCLPTQFSDFTHHRCYATGWGKDAFGNTGKFSHVLKEVEIPVVDSQQCQQALQSTRLGQAFSLHEGNLCAGGEEGRDTCKGDGGGPLVCSGPDSTIQLVGLVSWGIGCGHPGVPGVYVKVAHYLDWIRDITRV